MENLPSWKATFQREIQRAAAARARGNEGQARVCARRAAGAVAREYLSRAGMQCVTPSAYDLLRQLMGVAGLPETVHTSAGYLTLRVNEAFKLPVAVDLVQEARNLAQALFPNELE